MTDSNRNTPAGEIKKVPIPEAGSLGAVVLERDTLRDEVAALRAERDELHALITDGRNLQLRLSDALGELESAIREDWSEPVRERVFGLLDAGRRDLYEWEKRAQRWTYEQIVSGQRTT